jgi:hypothetical protein
MVETGLGKLLSNKPAAKDLKNVKREEELEFGGLLGVWRCRGRGAWSLFKRQGG